MKIAKESINPTSANIVNLGLGETYNSSKFNLGKGIQYHELSSNKTDKFITPILQSFRPMEESTSFGYTYIDVLEWSDTIHYIFGIEASASASSARRIGAYQFNPVTNAKSWLGFITITLGSSTAHTVRDLKIDQKLYSSGTASCSGTAVTGSGTAWNSSNIALGARIGFGSTDPTQITTWYRISSIGSDTSITLASNAGTISSGAYCIEECRFVLLYTNATVTNGGIYYVKGTTIEDFITSGTTINGGSVEGTKSCFWIKDATTLTLTGGCGLALDRANATDTSLIVYALNTASAGNYNVFKFNIRAALTVTSGYSVSPFLYKTANQAVTGTVSQTNNLSWANTSHGPGAGTYCLYFITSARIYRADTALITNGSSTWISDNQSEYIVGGSSLYSATGNMISIAYAPVIDRFIVSSNGTTNILLTLIRYNSDVPDNILYRSLGLNDSGNMPTDFPLHISLSQSGTNAHACSAATSYILIHKTLGVSGANTYAINSFADPLYAEQTEARLILPKISTPNNFKFNKIYIDYPKNTHSTTPAYIKPYDPVKIFIRTTNIDANTTDGWSEVNQFGDISSYSGASEIQAMVEFNTITDIGLPARVYGYTVIYESNDTIDNYQFSQTKSSSSSKQFAYRFATAFGTSVPHLRIRLYDAVTGGLLVDDNTSTPTGTWERSADGVSWSSWNNTDKGNETTYLRWTPASLADNVNVKPILTLL